jgi:hypothetical protein
MLIGVVVVASLLFVQIAGGVARGIVSDDPSHVELVQTCLVERATPFEEARDPIAESAGRGALRTIVDGNAVTVALGTSEADSARVYEAYAAVATADVVAALLERRRKVVFLWEREPTSAQREFMILCTLDAQE